MSYHTDEDELIKAVKDGMDEVKKKLTTEAEEILEHKFTAFMRDNLPSGYTNLRPCGSGNSGSALIAKITGAKAVADLVARNTKSASVPLDGMGIDVLVKAVIGTVSGESSSVESYPVAAHRVHMMGNDARPVLRLLQAVPRLQTGSNSFEFAQLTSDFANAADVQATEGALKANQPLDTELVTVPIRTVAVTMKASNQVLADAPQFSMFLQSRLVYGVMQKLESLLVSDLVGGGTTVVPTSSLSIADAISEAAANLDANGWTANIVVMHPEVWHEIRTERATAGGEYVAQGGWASPAGPSVWGLPVVATAACPKDTVLVIDTAQIALIDRMAPLFEAGLSDDDFSRNLTTLRAEARAATAIFSPGAVSVLAI